MALSNYHNLSNAQYLNARNYQIKLFENPDLLSGADADSPLELVIGILTIGYGWDIDQNSAQETINKFSQSGIALTQSEITALQTYKSGSSRLPAVK